MVYDAGDGVTESDERLDLDQLRDQAQEHFAGRPIEGEIKRHFRDTAWTVRVPRSTKELHLSVKTIEYYREQIKRKLNLSSAAELTQHATTWVQHEQPA